MARKEQPFGMDPLSDQGLRTVACSVRLTRQRVPPGAPFSLSADVVSADARDLRGATLALTDAEGAEVAHLALVDFDGETNRTASVQLRAPASPGACTWKLTFARQRVKDVPYAEAIVDVAFEVVAHPIRVNVWGLPTAPIAGSTVRVHVGAKGASDASVAGRAFEIVDGAGSVVAKGTFGPDVAPGTTGLHMAEVVLPTSPEPGIERWALRVPGFDEPEPHGEAHHEFSVRTAAEPSRTVTVRAIDAGTRAPVARAEAVLHPYRSKATDGGVATVSVANGTYTLFVTAPGYEVFRTEVDVSDDLELDAELAAVVEPDLSENYV
jgi:hypothetical protein